ncbi:MAG: sensor histidine kinase [Fusobacteriaceae bacterium]
MRRIGAKFFHKVMVYSVSIAFVGITVVQFLNFTLLDKFYIYRKKIEIPIVAKEIKKLKNNPEELTNYIDGEMYETGMIIRFGNFLPQELRNLPVKNLSEDKNIEKSRHPKYELAKKNRVVELRKSSTGMRYLIYRENIDGTPLYITLPLISLENYRYEAKIIELISILIALGASFLLGSYFSKRLTRNIEKLNDAARKIAQLNFVEKIDIQSRDEIGELAQSVEEMARNLKNSIESLKSFVSNASHELKTPIAVINMTSQNLKKGVLKDPKDLEKAYNTLVRETGEMTSLIENLMILSKVSYSENLLAKKFFNLKNLVKDSLNKYELLEIEKDLEINLVLPENLEIQTDYNSFKIAVDNLIQNALKYSVYGEKIDIYYEAGEFFIKNSFENRIDEENYKLLEPFNRGSNSNSEIEGSGLGLSIVKRILELLKIQYAIEIERNIFVFKLKL